MSYKIEGLEKKNYIQITVTGCIENSKEDVEYSAEVFKLVSNFNHSKVLIDSRKLRFKTSIIDQVKLVDSYSESGLFPQLQNYKIAAIIDPMLLELAHMWEILTNNKGYDFKIFYDSKQAESWLIV